MANRGEMFAKEVDLAASRAHGPEERDLEIIVNEHASRGMATSGANIQTRHERRWRTVAELLAFRLRLEQETPLLAEDETSWYERLVACIDRIVGQEQDRLLHALDQDYRRFVGGPLSDTPKREAVEMVSAISEEIAKPQAERRTSVLRMASNGLWEIVKHVDKLAAAYELVKAAARSQGIELP